MKNISKYYALAIQRNSYDVEKLEKKIWAIFYHKVSTDLEPQHHLYNPERCPYLKAQANKESYKHKSALSADVQAQIKPVFEQLTEKKFTKTLFGKKYAEQ